jgi:uncharacterized membrane protein
MWLVLLAAALTAVLFALNIQDFINVRRERRNGPVQFMNLDNLRHQGFILFIVFVVLARIYGLLSSEQAFKLVTVVIIFDAALTFFRRRKMADLVGQYLSQSQKLEIQTSDLRETITNTAQVTQDKADAAYHEANSVNMKLEKVYKMHEQHQAVLTELLKRLPQVK